VFDWLVTFVLKNNRVIRIGEKKASTQASPPSSPPNYLMKFSAPIKLRQHHHVTRAPRPRLGDDGVAYWFWGGKQQQIL
jgi:hypothetical protein